MNLKKILSFSWIIFASFLFESFIKTQIDFAPLWPEECTSAVVAGWATADGRSLLWKNRDADVIDNKIVLFTEGPLKALALVNADSLTSVWMGVNEAGFAIINTVSDDLEGSSSSENGSFQKRALLNCRTVEEFEELIRQTNNPGRATKANYGVIDAEGKAAYFEVGNHTYTRFDVGEAGFLIRTNFAFTGDGTGQGMYRYQRAFQLINKAVASRTISPEFILRQVARDLVNDVLNPYPLPYPYGQDGLPPGYIRTANSINRFRTRSAVVIQGIKPGEDPKLTTMWVMLGEPVCTVALPLWLLAEDVPLELNGSFKAAFGEAAWLKKKLCYPLSSREEYLNTAALDDGRGGGLFAYTFPLEDWLIRRTQESLTLWRQQKPTVTEVRYFQNELASLAYACFLACTIPKEGLPSPQNLKCQLVKNRSLFLIEWGHYLSWEKPYGDFNPVKYRVYDVSLGEKKMLAEVPSTQRTYYRRNIDPTKPYIYALLGVDDQGQEGNPAVIQMPAFSAVKLLGNFSSNLNFFLILISES